MTYYLIIQVTDANSETHPLMLVESEKQAEDVMNFDLKDEIGFTNRAIPVKLGELIKCYRDC